jgi:hypothetical protein
VVYMHTIRAHTTCTRCLCSLSLALSLTLVLALWQVLAWEAGRKYGVRVNTISAGPLASRAAIAIKKVLSLSIFLFVFLGRIVQGGREKAGLVGSFGYDLFLDGTRESCLLCVILTYVLFTCFTYVLDVLFTCLTCSLLA